MRKIKLVLKAILLSLIPGILTYIGSSHSFLDNTQKNGIIGENVNIESIKDWCSILGIVLTFLFITVNQIYLQRKAESNRSQRDNLLLTLKEALSTAMAEAFGRKEMNLNIRIFVPERLWLWKIQKKLGQDRKLFFRIINAKALASADNTDDLRFEVYPNPQGLVGECFASEEMIYDDDLINSNDRNYRLDKYQIDKTTRLRFSLTEPIYDNNSKVIAIIAFDSTTSVKITEQNKGKIINLVTNFKQGLYKDVPELFNQKE